MDNLIKFKRECEIHTLFYNKYTCARNSKVTLFHAETLVFRHKILYENRKHLIEMVLMNKKVKLRDE